MKRYFRQSKTSAIGGLSADLLSRCRVRLGRPRPPDFAPGLPVATGRRVAAGEKNDRRRASHSRVFFEAGGSPKILSTLFFALAQSIISSDMTGLVKAFQIHWSDNSEMHLKTNMLDSRVTDSIDAALSKHSLPDYLSLSKEIIKTIQDSLTRLANESLTHLVLFAFVQRAFCEEAAFIQRELALGRQRAIICPFHNGRGYPLEHIIQGHKSQDASIKQLLGYMEKCQALEGWLVVFDMDFENPMAEKNYRETKRFGNLTIHVVGC
ncbi:MAG: hypothetical protein LBJ61_11200 [Deltaproteobacteria bacterium]|jgi:hypothetical protein|nr:hypothetical protein [Deltaproteobacteria bacterium]